MVALLVNAGLAVAKAVGFVVTGSGSLLAEAVHSVADAWSQALFVLGVRQAQSPPAPDHPEGFGRERHFWGFAGSIIVFSLGGAFAVLEGVDRIRDPRALDSVPVAVVVLVVALAVQAISLRRSVVGALGVKDPQTGWWTFVRRSRDPELPVLLLEGVAALSGLLIALAATVAAQVTGAPAWDGVGTLTVGLLLVAVAVLLAIEMRGLLIGESASRHDLETISAAIEVEPSVQRLVHMRTQHIGPDELLVGAKIELVADLSVAEAAEAVRRVESSVRRVAPVVRILYLEPDVVRTAVPREHDAPAHLGVPTVGAD